jgi:hypothetical protein
MKSKKNLMALLGMAMAFEGTAQSEYRFEVPKKKQSPPPTEKLPTWVAYRNVYSANDVHFDLLENVPESAHQLFRCQALNKKNAIRKFKNSLRL